MKISHFISFLSDLIITLGLKLVPFELLGDSQRRYNLLGRNNNFNIKRLKRRVHRGAKPPTAEKSLVFKHKPVKILIRNEFKCGSKRHKDFS